MTRSNATLGTLRSQRLPWYNRKRILGSLITPSLLRSFNTIISLSVILQLVLSAFFTFIFSYYEIYFEIHFSAYLVPIIFPLSFSINAAYQRRELVLQDLASFKANAMSLYLCHREWTLPGRLPPETPQKTLKVFSGLIQNFRFYFLSPNEAQRQIYRLKIYQLLSLISELNDAYRASQMVNPTPIINRAIQMHTNICHSFERMRVVREYRTPRSLRAFTKIFIFSVPILISPYFALIGHVYGPWSGYYAAVLVSFMFGCLQSVQDILDDPFDQVGEDDVNVNQFTKWTEQTWTDVNTKFTHTPPSSPRIAQMAALAGSTSSAASLAEAGSSGVVANGTNAAPRNVMQPLDIAAPPRSEKRGAFKRFTFKDILSATKQAFDHKKFKDEE